MQDAGALGQQVEDVAVVALGLRRCRGGCAGAGVDAGEELGEAPGAGAGGQDALLVVAELGQDQAEVAVALVLVDLGQQLGLRAAGAGGIAFRRGDGDVLQVDLGGQDAAGPVGHLQGQGPPQHPEVRRAAGDRGEPDPLPGRGVDPVPEPGAADGEVEAPEQGDAVARVVVQLLGEPDGAVDRFDDDPLIVGAAERLALDDLAGDPEALQAGDRFPGRAAAADAQFHQLAGPHA